MRIILAAFLAIAFSTASLGEKVRTIDLALGGSVELEPGVNLQFDKVLGDSRCPADVVCVWPGEAKLQFSLTHGNAKPQSFVLSSLDPKEVEVDGLRLKLVRLQPDRLDRQRDKTLDYRTTLTVGIFR